MLTNLKYAWRFWASERILHYKLQMCVENYGKHKIITKLKKKLYCVLNKLLNNLLINHNSIKLKFSYLLLVTKLKWLLSRKKNHKVTAVFYLSKNIHVQVFFLNFKMYFQLFFWNKIFPQISQNGRRDFPGPLFIDTLSLCLCVDSKSV